jgi:ribosomal protein S18 acetylase RimI-like enzyme
MDETQARIDPSSIVPPGSSFTVRAIDPETDKPWVRRLLKQYWASTRIVGKGQVHEADQLPGFGAFRDNEPVGLITYIFHEIGNGAKDCEIVTHNSLAGSGGIGSCLLAAVRHEARAAGCRRLWLITTNDNTPALRFYQRRDFDLVALYRDAIAAARALKPEIPDLGLFGIPLKHELELEYIL